MPIRFACPVCKTEYVTADQDAGKKTDCRKCGQRLQVPAPARNRTVLGEVVPEPPAPAPAAPPSGRTAPAPAGGPVHFTCPHCLTPYTVGRETAGRPFECRACGHTMTVPGPGGTPEPARPAPRPAPPPQPVAQDPEPEPIPLRPVDDAPPAEDDYALPAPRRSANGPANRVVGSLGAGLLLVGLFLPMVHAPGGFWMSFIDVPWKVLTVGLSAAGELGDGGRPPAGRDGPAPRREGDAGPDKSSGAPAVVVVVAIGAVAYPLVVLGLVGYAAFRVAAGRGRRGYLWAGILSMLATFTYACGFLLLALIPELRLVLVLLSPGFGWGVVLVGGFILTVAGLIRPRGA